MKRKWISLLLTMTMMASMLTGCGGDAPSSGESQSADTGGSGVQESGDSQGGEQESGTSGEADGDLVPVTWMILGMDYEESDTWPTETFKDLQEALREYAGVELTMEGCDAQELDLLLAGSELPDIITVNRDYCNTLLTGKKVMKLDDYLDLAPNLESLSATRMAAMRKYYSNGDGGLYFWTPFIGKEPVGSEEWNGFTIRWDWYKELGYPEVKDEDEFLDVVKQIVDNHPTTENGDKVYGVATFSDGSLWGWWAFGCFYGFHNLSDAYSIRIADNANEVVNNFTTMDSPVWHAIEYYYKANQMGIFDPDSLTMKGEDLNAKATNGQLVSPLCGWYKGSLYDNARAEDPDTLAGYMVLPVEGQYNWDGAQFNIGWQFYTGVSAETPYVEQIMKVFDYMNSEEGARMAYMGKEGRVWEMVDGAPAIKEEYVDLKLNGDSKEIAQKTNSMAAHMIGLSHSAVLSDGGTANLWNSPEIWKRTLSPLQQDFCEHYGVEVPSQAAQKLVEEGKAFDKSAGTMAQDVIALMPGIPADISRIDTRCTDIMIKAIPNLVLAEDQAAFDRIKEETLAELEAADIQTSIDWWSAQEKDIKEYLQTVE